MSAVLRPLTQISRPQEIVRQFTPNWFTATMGTGILSLTLVQVPFAHEMTHAIGTALWLLTIALFSVFGALFLGRAIFFRASFARLFTHPVQSMFLGAIPMGLATIGNGFLAFGVPAMGAPAVAIANGIWWVDVVLAVACGWFVPYLMFTRQDHALEKMTAVWLLPIVPAEVTAAAGGLLAPHLDGADGRTVVGISVFLWTLSVPLALAVLAILFMRLALHSIPPSELAVSGWLTLGPLGTGALSMILLGDDATAALAGTSLAPLGPIAHGFGLLAGVLLWGYGAWWWVMAIVMTAHHAKTGLPFNMGWWGFTFPLGVYTAATFALARETHAVAFTVLGTLFVAMLALLWSVVIARTAHGAWHGALFRAPCLGEARA